MKKRLNIFYIAFFILGTSIALFAQPGSGNGTGDLESDDVALPIDAYLWVLILVGLTYVFLKLNSISRQKGR